MSTTNKSPFCREIEVQSKYLIDDVNGNGSDDKVSIILKKHTGLFCPTDGKTVGGYVKIDYDNKTFERSENFWDPSDGYSSGTFGYQADQKIVTFQAHQIGHPLWTFYISKGKTIPKNQVNTSQVTWRDVFWRKDSQHKTHKK